MMMSAWAVNVAVREFFAGSTSNLDNFHLEVELNAGERMVGIDGDGVKSHFDDGYNGTATG